MFIAALFTVAKLWKQPRCPSLMNGLRKCVIYVPWNFIQPIKNEIFSLAGKWMELENIILSEVSQVQKAKSCMFSLIGRPNTSTRNIVYTYKYIESIYPKVRLVE
jgi:hypothetical protein